VLCTTLYYMATVTVRLERDLDKQLDRVSKQTHRTRSDIVRDALRRQFALLRFEDSRRQLKPIAEAAGYLTDEDVFRDIS
jgi:predicted transcriptional regulator